MNPDEVDELSRTVRAFLPASGEVSALNQAFGGDPSLWLPDARRGGQDQWRVRVRAVSVSRFVLLAVGAPWRAGSTLWRTIRWDPVPEEGEAGAIDRMLPSFDGEIGLTRHRSTIPTLVLDGRYAPPGGVLGAAIDTVALHRVARATADNLLADIGERLGAAAPSVSGQSSPEQPPSDGSGLSPPAPPRGARYPGHRP